LLSITAHNLSKTFGSVVALQDVNLAIRAGEFYGLLGPNGAGKTTLLRILSGLLTADSGELEIHAANGHAQIIGVVPQEIALYEVLTARENLKVFGSVMGLRGAQLSARIAQVLEWVGLEDRAKSKVKTFSGGMMRRLNLTVGLLADPPVMLLDEPTVGVDPQSRAKIFGLLSELHASGKTIIYTTHYMEEAERLCQRIGILDHGRLLAEGSLSDLLAKVKLPRFVRVHGAFEQQKLPAMDGVECTPHDDYADYVPRANSDLGALITRINQSGLRFERLEIKGANLETLFLQLTGTELRD